MLPDRVSNPGPLTYEFGALPIALRGPAQTSKSPPIISLLAVPRRLFCSGSLVILDVACCYLWLFSLYKNR